MLVLFPVLRILQIQILLPIKKNSGNSEEDSHFRLAQV